MKIVLTGTVQSFADKKETVVLTSQRRTKEGPATETFYLRFHSPQAYEDFKGQYKANDGVQVLGLLRQIQTPLLDRATKAPLVGTSGHELRNALLAVEVREHKPVSVSEFDTIYVHGLVGIVDKKELRQSQGGLAYMNVRVAYNHYKRADEEQGQGDFYNMVAFGAQAESLNNLEKGDKLVVDHAIVSASPYEVRDLTHSDGTAITRNSPELTLRDFSYLPRAVRSGEAFGSGRADATRQSEEIPF